MVAPEPGYLDLYPIKAYVTTKIPELDGVHLRCTTQSFYGKVYSLLRSIVRHNL